MTARGASLLLVPLIVVALGAATPGLLVVGLVVCALATAAVVVDGRRAPGRGALRIERRHEPVLSVGVPNRIDLVIATGGARARGVVRDECPPEMIASAGSLPLAIPGEVAYSLTPRVRGEATFGRTVIRAEGPWRLGFRQTAFDDARTVPVEADISALRSFEALARRGQLAEMGVRSFRTRGEGTEFERVREAVPDDALRLVNWAATARTGRLMISELVPERAQPVVICLDHGRLMGVGAGMLTKLDSAINAALLLVHVALRSGDRVGLFSFADTVTTTVIPRAGRLQMRRILDAVRPLRAGDTEADYDNAFAQLQQWQRRRALLVVFTDVADSDQSAALVRQCTRLNRRHAPLVITVRDPAIEDASRQPPVDAASTYRRAIASGLIAGRDETLRTLRHSGVETIDADARTLSPRLVNRYLELKRRARI